MEARPIFLVGPPRTGTTLLTYLLAGGEGILSLSEPFLIHAVSPPWHLHRFFSRLQKTLGLKRVAPPRKCSADAFLAFLRELAARNGLPTVLIKETFRDHGEGSTWDNVPWLEQLAASGAAVIATIRHPYDAAASAVRLTRRFPGVREFLSNAMMFPNCPRFSNADQVVRWSARNWLRCLAWSRASRLTLIAYEQLVRDPRHWLRIICDNCDLPFDERMLDYRYRRTAFGGVGAPEVMKHPPHPVHSRSVGRGDALSNLQRDIIRQSCGAEATELGYSLA